jgi:hypothetical protein
MKSTSGTSIKYLNSMNYMAQAVEQWNHFSKRRMDLFGFIDVVAVKNGEHGVLGIQACGRFDINRHIEKAICSCGIRVRVWLGAGNRLYFHGWDKLHHGKIRLKVVELLLGSTDVTFKTVEREDIEMITSKLKEGKIVICDEKEEIK